MEKVFILSNLLMLMDDAKVAGHFDMINVHHGPMDHMSLKNIVVI